MGQGGLQTPTDRHWDISVLLALFVNSVASLATESGDGRSTDIHIRMGRHSWENSFYLENPRVCAFEFDLIEECGAHSSDFRREAQLTLTVDIKLRPAAYPSDDVSGCHAKEHVF